VSLAANHTGLRPLFMSLFDVYFRPLTLHLSISIPQSLFHTCPTLNNCCVLRLTQPPTWESVGGFCVCRCLTWCWCWRWMVCCCRGCVLDVVCLWCSGTVHLVVHVLSPPFRSVYSLLTFAVLASTCACTEGKNYLSSFPEATSLSVLELFKNSWGPSAVGGRSYWGTRICGSRGVSVWSHYGRGNAPPLKKRFLINMLLYLIHCQWAVWRCSDPPPRDWNLPELASVRSSLNEHVCVWGSSSELKRVQSSQSPFPEIRALPPLLLLTVEYLFSRYTAFACVCVPVRTETAWRLNCFMQHYVIWNVHAPSLLHFYESTKSVVITRVRQRISLYVFFNGLTEDDDYFDLHWTIPLHYNGSLQCCKADGLWS